MGVVGCGLLRSGVPCDIEWVTFSKSSEQKNSGDG